MDGRRIPGVNRLVRELGSIPADDDKGIIKETVFLNGTIVGGGQRVTCKVRVTKSTMDSDPDAPPEFSDYDIMDSAETVRLPDGDYEVLINDRAIRCKLSRGRFLWQM